MKPLMRIIVGVLAAAVIAYGASAQTDQRPQVAGIDGLFMMPGLQEVDGEAVIFDKPEGRIIEVLAHGTVSAGAVDAWYAQSLKAHGWKQSKLSGQYFKDGEALQLAIRQDASGVTLRFSLAPKD
jgi:hypothetical protein